MPSPPGGPGEKKPGKTWVKASAGKCLPCLFRDQRRLCKSLRVYDFTSLLVFYIAVPMHAVSSKGSVGEWVIFLAFQIKKHVNDVEEKVKYFFPCPVACWCSWSSIQSTLLIFMKGGGGDRGFPGTKWATTKRSFEDLSPSTALSIRQCLLGSSVDFSSLFSVASWSFLASYVGFPLVRLSSQSA